MLQPVKRCWEVLYGPSHTVALTGERALTALDLAWERGERGGSSSTWTTDWEDRSRTHALLGSRTRRSIARCSLRGGCGAESIRWQ